KTGIDNHHVFGAHGRGDRREAFFVAAVVLVLAVRDDACRRSDRQERLLDLHGRERGFEIVDVALELRLAGIGDRRDANRICAGPDLVARIELGIEFSEALTIGAALEWVCADLQRATFKTTQPFERILRPTDRLSEFAVAYHIDSGFSLSANNLGDTLGQACVIAVPVEAFARLLPTQKRLQPLRPDQTADMGGQDAVNAALHLADWGSMAWRASSRSRHSQPENNGRDMALLAHPRELCWTHRTLERE